jgi:hypothetical protein
MFLKEFNIAPAKKISKLNQLLKDQFGVSMKNGFPTQDKLRKISETANTALVSLRNSNKKFQLDPEYTKFLGIRDVVNTMLSEGQYAESGKYKEMKEMLCASVQDLMDAGYTMDEACSECMNRYRMDNRFAYDDEHVLPIVITAAKNYMEACGMKHESVAEVLEIPETDLSDKLLSQLSREFAVELTDTSSLTAIEEKLATFAKVSGKSRDAIVGFLNGLEEAALTAGIQMFGRKIAEQNKFTGARVAAIRAGKKEFEVDGKTYSVTGNTTDEKQNAKESMFDGLLDELLTEEVDVEQAEVVMAVRALADDIQDQIERLGRMMNEDVPAIADQMRAEMGASQAQTWSDSTNQMLSAHLESAKTTKAGMDQSVASLSGEELAGGLGDTAGLGMEEPAADLGGELDTDIGLGEPESDLEDNVAAAAGPEDAPLGRAEV